MKALYLVAVALTAAPVAAAIAEDGPTDERRVCTRVELRGGSRISYQRVCRTPTEWRERLGADWQQILSGRSPDQDMDNIDVLNRSTVEVPNLGLARSFGRPGGGTSGPQ